MRLDYADFRERFSAWVDQLTRQSRPQEVIAAEASGFVLELDALVAELAASSVLQVANLRQALDEQGEQLAAMDADLKRLDEKGAALDAELSRQADVYRAVFERGELDEEAAPPDKDSKAAKGGKK